MPKCSTCDNHVVMSVKSLIMGATQCEDCVKRMSESPAKEKSPKISVHTNPDNFPEEVKKIYQQEIEEGKIDPDKHNVMAIGMSISDDDSDDGEVPEVIRDLLDGVPDKLGILIAQRHFNSATEKMGALLHALTHTSVPRHEITSMVKQWTDLQWRLLSEYMYPESLDTLGPDNEPMTRERLEELNLSLISSCGDDD